MNRNRFQSDMEAAWELRPATDETPGSRAHHNRFASGSAARQGSGNSLSASGGGARAERDTSQKTPPAAKNRGNGS